MRYRGESASVINKFSYRGNVESETRKRRIDAENRAKSEMNAVLPVITCACVRGLRKAPRAFASAHLNSDSEPLMESTEESLMKSCESPYARGQAAEIVNSEGPIALL